MSSGNSFERLWKLQASANKIVLDGKREPEALADILQVFVFGNSLPDIDWALVYAKLGMKAEYSRFAKMHGIKAGSDVWTVPVVKGVSCNKVVAAMQKLGVRFCLYADDLDAYIATNDRDPANGSYSVSFHSNVEADEEFKNLSANQLKETGHHGITLLERLLLELGYFLATGKHLDEKNWTLCTGSRYRSGDVPDVDWHLGSRGVYVNYYYPGYSGGNRRSRSVVSQYPPA